MDGGFGTDANINWALWRGYHILSKGYSGKRASLYARTITDWHTLVKDRRWIAWVPRPKRYGRRTRMAVLRWVDQDQKLRHATLVSSLDLSLSQMVACYDQRGATEVEIRSDKSGLCLTNRRKKRMAAQEALILMTDLSHNLAAWLRPWMLQDSPFACYGPQRVIRDIMTVPGKVYFHNQHLKAIKLDRTHPYAKDLVPCLERLFTCFGLR